MHARVPFMTTLSEDDVMFEDGSSMTPLFETEASTGGIFLVLGGTSHHLGGE